jgi:hypothetical protein
MNPRGSLGSVRERILALGGRAEADWGNSTRIWYLGCESSVAFVNGEFHIETRREPETKAEMYLVPYEAKATARDVEGACQLIVTLSQYVRSGSVPTEFRYVAPQPPPRKILKLEYREYFSLFWINGGEWQSRALAVSPEDNDYWLNWGEADRRLQDVRTCGGRMETDCEHVEVVMGRPRETCAHIQTWWDGVKGVRGLALADAAPSFAARCIEEQNIDFPTDHLPADSSNLVICVDSEELLTMYGHDIGKAVGFTLWSWAKAFAVAFLAVHSKSANLSWSGSRSECR